MCEDPCQLKPLSLQQPLQRCFGAYTDFDEWRTEVLAPLKWEG